MNAKKIITLITALALILSFTVVPASAAIDPATVSFEIVDETGIVGQNIDVVVKMTGSVSLFALDLGYNTEYLSYVSATTCNATVTAEENASVVTLARQETSALDLDDATLATITFTALSKEAFDLLEVEEVTAEFTFAPQQEPIGGGEYENNLYPGLGGVGFANEAISYDLGAIVISLPPTAPTADPTIDNAEPMVGDTLTATSGYADVNGDAEEGTTYEWLADGESLGEASTTNTYVVTGAEVGKVITVKVTPKTTVAPVDGKAVVSAATAAVVVNPALKATVEGLEFTEESKFKVGKEIFISYDLVSPNAGEDASTIKWTDADGNDLVGVVAEDGMSFVPDKEDKDKIVKVTVTPKDSLTEANTEAIEIIVAEEAIAKASSNSSGYTPNSGANLAGKTPEEEPTDKPDEPVDPETPAGFADVDAEKYAWAVEYINALAEEGIFKGRDEKTFDPEAQITRAEFVALVARVLGATSEADLAYADLEGHWAAAEVTAVAELGVLDFIVDEFAPDQAITREEMATVLYKALVAKDVEIADVEVEEFTDASSISEYAVEAIKALQSLEILNGMGDGTFAPKAETTRAQTAKVVYLFASLVK